MRADRASTEAAAGAAREIGRSLRHQARWTIAEILFWLAAAATLFLLPERHLILNEIAIIGLFALSLDLILGYAGIVSLGHAAFFGLGAYTAGLLAKYVLGRSAPWPHGGGDHGDHPRLRDELSRPARRRPDAPHGDAGPCPRFGRNRQPSGLADRRRRWAAGRGDEPNPRHIRVRYFWPDGVRLQPSGHVRALPNSAPHRRFAIRAVAARHPRQSAARPRRRDSGEPPSRRDLYAGGRLCGHRRRAARTDHAVRLPRRGRLPPLGGRPSRSRHRRRRLSVRRLYRRHLVQGLAGRPVWSDATILAVLDRRSSSSSSSSPAARQ